ncbi:MAG TPA: hypothetical protein VIE66_16290 [Methylocella sp.]
MITAMSQNEKARNVETCALINGIVPIADFFELPPKKTNRLAAGGYLPGVFKLGSQYFLDPSVAKEAIHEKARAGVLRAQAQK